MHNIFVLEIRKTRLPVDPHVMTDTLKVMPQMYRKKYGLKKPVAREKQGEICGKRGSKKSKRYKPEECPERKKSRQYFKSAIDDSIPPRKIRCPPNMEVWVFL